MGGFFCDRPIMRTDAQLRAEIESRRARGLYTAGWEFSPATMLRADAQAQYSNSSSTVGKLNLLRINKLIGAENPCHYIPVRDAILHGSA